jgi:pyridoxal phosphate enzyme (YggS family)
VTATAEPSGAADRRTAELAANLAALTVRVEAAARAAARPAGGIAVVAVTKTFPAADIRRLAGLGVADIGENRHQEARAKHAALAGLPVRWHFLGRLQTNKCAAIAGYAGAVHSVDRPEVVGALAAGARRAGRLVDALVQVSVDGDPARGGVPLPGVAGLADAVADTDGLRLAGVMVVAPADWDAGRAFEVAAGAFAATRAAHPGATMFSAGMSGDLEAAVAAGATHLRIGTALMGGRPAHVR